MLARYAGNQKESKYINNYKRSVLRRQSRDINVYVPHLFILWYNYQFWNPNFSPIISSPFPKINHPKNKLTKKLCPDIHLHYDLCLHLYLPKAFAPFSVMGIKAVSKIETKLNITVWYNKRFLASHNIRRRAEFSE